MAFQRTFSGAPWEEVVGYCRALRAGNHVFVSGTAPLDEKGEVFRPGDATSQTRRCLEIIETALKSLGADRTHITRTRLYVTNISRWAEYGEAHQAFFGEHRPATAMIQVSNLVDPQILIEIEADAVLDAATDDGAAAKEP